MSDKPGSAGSDRVAPGGAASDDAWRTLGHTASMSPDERVRRGLTPPDGASGDRAAPEPTSLPSGPFGTGVTTALPLDDGNRYELEGVHARGGLGRVVRAHDRLLQRTVAIKELLQRTPAAQARFLREALITARLQHPGIVPVHEAGRWPSGDPYYSMKLVSGRTLKELIQARPGLDERLALLPHVLAVAEAIAYAHSQGVIHRDIKPANVIVGDFGETVVVDWGLAKDLSGRVPEAAAGFDSTAGEEPPVDSDGEAATAAGHIMGTPAYMAPEQARGDASDARSDVYSLGALLYELLAGAPPHTGDSADQILRSALSSAPIPVEMRQPAAPPDLVAIVHKAMERRPGDRYRSAGPLAEDIRRFQTGQLVSARQYSARTLVRRWIARHRGVVAVCVVAAVALAVTAAIGFQRVVAQRNLAEERQAQAQEAERAANLKRNDMTFLQAQSWLPRDPTAALAWLKRYPPDGPRADRLSAMVDEALELGVARHVLRQPTWVMGVGFTGDGQGLVGVLKCGDIIRWDVASAAGRLIGRHGETVRVAEVSPDGRAVAVGGAGGSVEIFSLFGEWPPRRLHAHADEIRWIGFSADSRRLMTGSPDRLRVWDLASGEPLLAVDGQPVTSVAFAPGGESIFVGLSSGAVVERRVTGGERRLAHLDAAAQSVAPSPDGQHLAAQWRDGAIALIEMATGAIRQLDLRGGKGTWGFSPSGRYLTAAGADGTIRLRELATGEETELRGHEDTVYHMAFSADESLLLTVSDDATARVWDLRTGGVRVLRGHEDDVTHAALSPDGKMAATGGLDSIRVWQLAGGESLSEVVRGGVVGPNAPWRNSVLTQDGSVALSWPRDERVTAWVLDGDRHQTETFEPVDRLEARFRHTAMPVFERRARLYAAPQPGGAVSLWNLASGERRELRGGDAEIAALAVGREGRELVAADAAGSVRLWDLTAPAAAPRLLLEGRRNARGAALSRAGDRLALAVEGRIDLYDTASGALVAAAELDTSGAPSDQPRNLEFSPDGRFLASRSKATSSLVLWNLASGETHRLDIGGHEVLWLAFSPDSSRLALAVTDRTVRLVETATGRSIPLQGHRDQVYAVAWSPDGRSLASASYDRTIRLWQADGDGVRVLRGHGGPVESVAFTPDGRLLVSASADGTVRRWHLDRLPEDSAQAVPQRLAAATTAVIASEAAERAATPMSTQAGRAAPSAEALPAAARLPAGEPGPAR